MIFLRFLSLTWLTLTVSVSGLSTTQTPRVQTDSPIRIPIATSTRRSWIRQGLVGVITGTVPFLTSENSALAYERRDVGGPGRSAETAAYNLQAFETNNRLEREGLKLETQEEQQKSLTAALAEYAYTPSTGSTNDGSLSKSNKGSSISSKALSSKKSSQ